MRRLALAAPQVAFCLETDGHVVFEAPAQARIERVAALLGADAAAVLLPVNAERDGLRISGYACAPSVTRATAAAQALVVNNRPVADPVLRTAVRVAYRDVIAAGGTRWSPCILSCRRMTWTSTCIRRRPSCASAIRRRYGRW